MENQDIFAKLDGFAVDTALSRLAGNRNLYKTLLTRFLEKYPGAATELRASLAAGNLEEVQRNAHTIKGLAASMGHDTLSEAAKVVEHSASDAIKDPAQQGAVAPAIESFAPILDSAMATLAAVLSSGATPAAAPAAKPVDRAALKAALAKMKALLDASDGEAANVFEQIASDLRSIDAGLCTMLRQSIQDFDFDQALRVVDVLHDRL